MYYAQLDANNIVISITYSSNGIVGNNIIEVDSMDNSILSKRYANGTFISVEKPPIRIYTVLQFRSKFTTEEKVAIYTAANSNVLVKIWLDDLASADFVDLDDPATIAAVNSLATAGLISSTRATEVLS
jgi:hypothetical protein